MNQLSSALRNKRTTDELSIRDVSEVTGVSVSTLSRYERGVGALDTDNLCAVAAWLGVSLDDKAVRVVTEDMLHAMCKVIRADDTIADPEHLCYVWQAAYQGFKNSPANQI